MMLTASFLFLSDAINTFSFIEKGGSVMKGYYNDDCYMGYLPSVGEYLRFDTDDEYAEYYRDFEEF